MEKKLSRLCGYCGEIGIANVDVFWQEDPFTWEMSMGEVIVKDWYHMRCAEELALSV